MAVYGRLNIGSTAVDFFFKREYFHLMSLNILTRIIHSHDVQWNKLQNLRYRHFRSMKSVSFCIHPHSHPPHLFIHFTSYMTAQLTLLNNRREEKKKKKKLSIFNQPVLHVVSFCYSLNHADVHTSTTC